MAVKRDQVSTIEEAYEYLLGSYQAAEAGVCPSKAALYAQLATTVYATSSVFDKADFLEKLAFADKQCTSAADYHPASSAPGATVDPQTGGAAPSDGRGGGDSTWVWLALGVGAYFLFS